MARRLEELDSGTPVFCRDRRVGEVRGVYGEGSAHLAEYLAVYWNSREAEILIPTNDVASLDASGVHLVADEQSYATLVVFEPSKHPTAHKLH